MRRLVHPGTTACFLGRILAAAVFLFGPSITRTSQEQCNPKGRCVIWRGSENDAAKTGFKVSGPVEDASSPPSVWQTGRDRKPPRLDTRLCSCRGVAERSETLIVSASGPWHLGIRRRARRRQGTGTGTGTGSGGRSHLVAQVERREILIVSAHGEGEIVCRARYICHAMHTMHAMQHAPCTNPKGRTGLDSFKRFPKCLTAPGAHADLISLTHGGLRACFDALSHSTRATVRQHALAVPAGLVLGEDRHLPG